MTPQQAPWTAGQIEEARRLDGLFVGMCEPEEYEHLLKAGVLIRVYEGVAGFMGLAKFRMTEAALTAAGARP